LSTHVDGIEVEAKYLEYGVKFADETLPVALYDTENEARFDQLLYPGSEVVTRQVFETAWATA
jgi:hypothetical protein